MSDEPDMDTKSPHLEISKINNFIYLGSYEHPYTDSEEFQKLNIDVIINCAEEVNYPLSDYTIFKYPLFDDEYASMLEYMDAAIEKIHRCLSSGKRIYIHCVKGISRSPAILIYYLMVHKKFTFDQAQDLLKKIRPIIDINSNFERELRTIED